MRQTRPTAYIWEGVTRDVYWLRNRGRIHRPGSNEPSPAPWASGGGGRGTENLAGKEEGTRDKMQHQGVQGVSRIYGRQPRRLDLRGVSGDRGLGQ